MVQCTHQPKGDNIGPREKWKRCIWPSSGSVTGGVLGKYVFPEQVLVSGHKCCEGIIWHPWEYRALRGTVWYKSNWNKVYSRVTRYPLNSLGVVGLSAGVPQPMGGGGVQTGEGHDGLSPFPTPSKAIFHTWVVSHCNPLTSHPQPRGKNCFWRGDLPWCIQGWEDGWTGYSISKNPMRVSVKGKQTLIHNQVITKKVQPPHKSQVPPIPSYNKFCWPPRWWNKIWLVY